MELKYLATEKVADAIGPYSQGVKVGNMIFTSGQIPKDPITGEVGKGDIQKETMQCLAYVKAIVEAGNGTIENIVKVTVFVTDINNFSAINEVYAEFFKDHKPARSLVEVSKLPGNVDIEIEAIAIL